MKRYLLLLAATVLLVAQQSRQIPTCGNDMNHDHPCACAIHVQQVQAQYMNDCIKSHMDEGEGPGKAQLSCAASTPSHCSITEHFGRWELGEDGEHSNPMPQQCTKACKWGHCLCGDNHEMCHYSHSPSDDAPSVAPKSKSRKK